MLVALRSYFIRNRGLEERILRHVIQEEQDFIRKLEVYYRHFFCSDFLVNIIIGIDEYISTLEQDFKEAQGLKPDVVESTLEQDFKEDFVKTDKPWVRTVGMTLPDFFFYRFSSAVDPELDFPHLACTYPQPVQRQAILFFVLIPGSFYILIYTFSVCKGLLEDAERSKDWKKFASWMSEHKKKYESDEEKLYRFGIFRGELKHIKKLNKEDNGCTFGLNQYSDLTNSEFNRLVLNPDLNKFW
uniref:Cathepsin propeptide inhibitor domain-containing protein n=1 Tax=Cucumis sativus TaxID=3659 RepID=A0A0A0L4P3_CUCSA